MPDAKKRESIGKRSHYPNTDTDFNIHQSGTTEFRKAVYAFIAGGHARADAIQEAQSLIKDLDALEQSQEA